MKPIDHISGHSALHGKTAEILIRSLTIGRCNNLSNQNTLANFLSGLWTSSMRSWRKPAAAQLAVSSMLLG
jgi:hypothetical protein